jgi:N-acetylneuraminic acid mutarotase
MAKLAELPHGISSHAAVRIKEAIYVIGGNKDMNIVTKSCLAFNYTSKEMRKIADLNYPSASHTAISWRDKYIYKFGGVGISFE